MLDNEQIDATTKYVVFPKEHLGLLSGNYLYQTGVLDQDVDKIASLTIPIEVDDEGLITIKVGLVEGWQVDLEGATVN